MAPITMWHHFDSHVTWNFVVEQSKCTLTSWRGRQQSETLTRRCIVTRHFVYAVAGRWNWWETCVAIQKRIERLVATGQSASPVENQRPAGRNIRNRALQWKRARIASNASFASPIMVLLLKAKAPARIRPYEFVSGEKVVRCTKAIPLTLKTHGNSKRRKEEDHGNFGDRYIKYTGQLVTFTNRKDEERGFFEPCSTIPWKQFQGFCCCFFCD